jgi:hypothetical protein
MRTEILKQLRKAGQPIVPIHLIADQLPGGFLRRAFSGSNHDRVPTRRFG